MLEHIVKKAKDPTENMLQKYVVYKIDCKDCSKTYVGQTKRQLETRVYEHQKNQNQNQKYYNVISKHIKDMNSEHNINWDDVGVLHKEYNWKKRLFAEMIYIKKQGNNALNKMTDLKDYPMCYYVLVNKL